MKPRILTAILLFVSAYSPLFLILAVKDFDFDQTMWFRHPIPIIALLIISLLSIAILFVSIKSFPTGSLRVQVIATRDRSVDIINYTIPYMISFFGIDLSKPADLIAITVFLSILLLLTITTKSVFINPILALAGYQLYDVEYRFDGRNQSSVVLSNVELKRGNKYRLLTLTPFLYLMTPEEKTNAE